MYGSKSITVSLPLSAGDSRKFGDDGGSDRSEGYRGRGRGGYDRGGYDRGGRGGPPSGMG